MASITYGDIDEIVPDTWKNLVPTIMAQKDAYKFIGKNRDATNAKPTLPVRELTFRALVPYPPKDWNVIIFGQNPYPRLESATGIAMFDGQYKDWQGTMSPSLRNIIKGAAMTELPEKVSKATKIDALRKVLKSENVVQPVQWFESTLKSKCLWLNTALTVGGSDSDNSHNKFWKPIIEEIIKSILSSKEKGQGVVVALWGNQAVKLRKLVDSINVFNVPIEFVESYNPAAQGDIFCNNSAFQAINDSLSKLHLEAIEWLPRMMEDGTTNSKKKHKNNTGGASSSSSKKDGVGAEEDEEDDAERARISNFMESTIELHQMLVDRIKDVKLESSLKVTGLLDGLSKTKLLPFRKALEISKTSSSLIDTAMSYAESHITPLASIDQVAALHLYTMGGSFYGTLNKCLRDAKPGPALEKFFPFLRLFLNAMDTVRCSATSSSKGGGVVTKQSLWRGVDVDLSKDYKKGTTITWWGVSSCTTNQSVALGFMHGKGTLFQIVAQTGVSVKPFSAFQGEDEVVLPPGTSLKVVSAIKKGAIYTINLETVE